jgi:hypothetical protein
MLLLLGAGLFFICSLLIQIKMRCVHKNLHWCFYGNFFVIHLSFILTKLSLSYILL